MTKTCILDVGANNGDFIFKVAERSPHIPVLGFEPTPELFEGLEAKKETLDLPNVELLKLAINTTSGVANFHVAKHADWGVSSLLDFDKSSLSENEYWAQRQDLYFDQDIQVEVARLDDVLLAAGYDHISFIKIDAQGVDLKVLESLGTLLSKVDAGMLEAPTTHKSALYSGEPTLNEVLVFLERHGFEPYAIKPNDPACAEVNVFFNKIGLDWQEIEERIGLKGIPLYDGKHYWHVPAPSAALPPGDPVNISILQELARARHVVAENSAAWARVMYWKNETEVLRKENERLSLDLNSQALHIKRPSSSTVTSSTSDDGALLAEVESLKSEISAIHQSTSWRITSFLRAIKRSI